MATAKRYRWLPLAGPTLEPVTPLPTLALRLIDISNPASSQVFDDGRDGNLHFLCSYPFGRIDQAVCRIQPMVPLSCSNCVSATVVAFRNSRSMCLIPYLACMSVR